MVRNLLRCLGALAAIALVGLAHEAYAEKVGVAAAVNPDAFSSLAGKPQSQLNIGKAIFYNERINTTGSGLVQVLLVDGSTFTVGPGSDLVIDRFVYDPKKGTGQITASFSKGVMRFVGGKISKNEGGVTVDTPAGTLAIRGGIAYGQFINPKNYAFLFVFGDYLKMNGLKVFEPGNGIFAQNGQAVIREFTAADVNLMMAALTNSNTGGVGPKPSEGPTSFKLVNTDSMNQLISDANTQQILGEAKQASNDQPESPPEPPCVGEECNPPPPPPPPPVEPLPEEPVEPLPEEPVEPLPEEPVEPLPEEPEEPLPEQPKEPLPPATEGTPGSFHGGVFKRQGNPQESGLLHDVAFGPQSNSVSFGISNGESALLTFKQDGSPQSATVFRNGYQLPSGVVQFTSSSLVTPRSTICEGCNFLEWGGWKAHLNYEQGSQDTQNPTNLFANGWWVSGTITTVPDLNVLGTRNATATYEGMAWASVLNHTKSYDASGNLNMTWSFAQRSGTLTISDFDESNTGGLNFGGTMTAPGSATQYTSNQFSGSLSGSGMTGSATGSFVNNGTIAAGGVMGNWGVSGDSYKASGVFGGAGTPRPGN